MGSYLVGVDVSQLMEVDTLHGNNVRNRKDILSCEAYE
jgi:hypothetical protein